MNVGNDLVCLLSAPDKTDSPRFILRVFNEHEQYLIQSVLNSHFLLWAIWAVKEATFKAYQQEKPESAFSPKLIEVTFDKDGFFEELFYKSDIARSRLQGYSKLGRQVYRFELFFEDNCIHSVVVKNPADFSDVSYKISKIVGDDDYKTQSLAAKKLALAFAKHQGVIADDIKREKLNPQKKSAPKFYRCGEKLSVPLSLSHDGAFVAVCLSAPKQ